MIEIVIALVHLGVGVSLALSSTSRGAFPDAVFVLLWPLFVIRHIITGR